MYLLNIILCTVALSLTANQTKNLTERQFDGYNIITQKKGATLGYSPDSGIRILYHDGYAFKDLNKNGELDIYEDWRQPIDKRVSDLTKQLSIEEIAGLMLYSSHESIPDTSEENPSYDGKPYAQSNASAWDMTDGQKKFLKEDHLRHILITVIESPEVAAKWNNKVQAYVEGIGHGIPANNSSDPRHSARADAEFNAGGGGDISMWPGSLGLAATFSPETVKRFGEIASEEYRALGFSTALSPQIDIATEPRWFRTCGTFGEDPYLSADMARAYCDGLQTSEGDSEISDGWGFSSVNAMVKHWPGGGACEAGRDAHYGFGKYAVYPGDKFETHKIPFTEGAFKLKGKTKKASAVMPYYTICFDQTSENTGNSYNQEIITDQLRTKEHFEGVICTDWGITEDEEHPGIHSGKPWGVENLTVAERHYKAIIAGVDQFGGNNDKVPVLEAYHIGVKKHGKEWMDKRMRISASRLLTNIFRTGLFENPYLDPEKTADIVGCPDFMSEGYDTQIKSTVMLKNHNNILPISGRKKVYIPNRHLPAHLGFWRNHIEEHTIVPISKEIASQYFTVVNNPEDADIAIVFIASPESGCGYKLEETEQGKSGYIPISLQYNDYTATQSRQNSIAGGDPHESFSNRSYLGKSTATVNKSDMETVIATKKAMGTRPVIVSINLSTPAILSEIEPYADAIFATFDIQNQVILDIVTGKYEPSALLPFQMPANMETVEQQKEDTPRDMECYKDSDGNTYDFAFGMNWNGVINDKRVKKYR